MCGIFSLLNYCDFNFSQNGTIDCIEEQFKKGKNRGPEFSKLSFDYLKMALGFHRLAINGLNDKSNQPLVINDIVLICNGEIYNYKELYKMMKITPETDSDCEAIIHLYLRYGIEQTLNMLDGVFAFVLFDNRITQDLCNRLYVARDPFGVRPLYQLQSDCYETNLHGFASELKCLEYFYNVTPHRNRYTIEPFPPGTFSIFEFGNKATQQYWTLVKRNYPYFIPSFSYSYYISAEELNTNIYNLVTIAVEKRCSTSDRPIACLLSGGLDSSLVASLVCNYFRNKKVIETYSIGLENSEDVKFARIVAKYIGSNHTEVIVKEDDMFNAIPDVIRAIESYDTTTVRASIGNYLIAKYISEHSQAKVIFNGDGSDELFGGYLYMKNCNDPIEFDRETRRLLKDIHLYDVLRSDKCISSNGLEPRTPFLDRNLVNYVLSVPVSSRMKNNNVTEKYILRRAFDNKELIESEKPLPIEILWRKKEAFSDGVSSKGRSLFQILQEKIADKMNADENTTKYGANIETEKYYYKKIFQSYYPNCEHVIPYYWMPKYTNATDPSARTLDVYEK